MPIVENILSDHMAGTQPLMSDPQSFIHQYLTTDTIFDRHGKSISSQRFQSKIVKENKSVLICHTMIRDINGQTVIVFDSVLTKPGIYVDIRRNIFQITAQEYIRVLSIKKAKEHVIILDNGVPKKSSDNQFGIDDQGLGCFYKDGIEIDEQTGAFQLPQERFQESLFMFAECIEKSTHPLKEEAYQIVLQLIENQYDLFTSRRYGLSKSDLAKYRESLHRKRQPVAQPARQQAVVPTLKKYSETFYRQTTKEFYEVFQRFQQGEMSANDYTYQTGHFFQSLMEKKGISLT